MFIEEYNQFVTDTLNQVFEENKEQIEKAAHLLFETEKNHHKIYTFGTGHSHMVGQDLYARAGGYAKIYPIVETELTLLTHPMKSTYIERTTEYADVLEQIYHLESQDVMIVTSNSGRNALVVEYVMRAKEKGVKIIAITSLSHSQKVTSRHSSGLRLFELADIVLDNFAPYGDAGIDIDSETRMGPVSTITGCYLSQSMAGRFVELLVENQMEAPVLRSGNMDHADEYNQILFNRYIYKKVQEK